MQTALRSAAAVVAGLIVAFVLVLAIEGISSVLHPFPPGFDPSDLEACRAHVARYPAWVLFIASTGWGLTSFAGSWLATRLGSRRHLAHGIVVGLILLTFAIANMLMLPYPIWFWVLNLIFLPVGSYCGALLGRGRFTA